MARVHCDADGSTLWRSNQDHFQLYVVFFYFSLTSAQHFQPRTLIIYPTVFFRSYTVVIPTTYSSVKHFRHRCQFLQQLFFASNAFPFSYLFYPQGYLQVFPTIPTIYLRQRAENQKKKKSKWHTEASVPSWGTCHWHIWSAHMPSYYILRACLHGGIWAYTEKMYLSWKAPWGCFFPLGTLNKLYAVHLHFDCNPSYEAGGVIIHLRCYLSVQKLSDFGAFQIWHFQIKDAQPGWAWSKVLKLLKRLNYLQILIF